MQFTNHKRRRAPTVIIVSLIDVLLVVLIFLMVTTTFKKEQPPSIKVNLPESKQAKPGASENKKPFVITVATNSPYLYVGEKPVTLDRLQTELAAEVKKDPELRVAIKADKRSPFGEVVKALDAAKLANVSSDRITALTEKTASK
jgi:biopolymer transport protein ExbD